MSPLKCGIDLIFTSKKKFFFQNQKFFGLQNLDRLLFVIASYRVVRRDMSPLNLGIDLIFTSKKIFFLFFGKKSAPGKRR
jgi:hypothetical protein